MRLVEHWRDIQATLGDDWGDARLLLTAEDEARAARAAALLAPLNAGRSGQEVRFSVARRGPGPRPDTAHRLLARLDREGIAGTLDLLASREAAEQPPAREAERPSLAASWRSQVAGLPPDWSDLYAELELRSSDHLEPAALLCSPLNPSRFDDTPAFRFRSARTFGYGASPEMVERCLERLDAARIGGDVRLLHALSETEPVATQGPVWYIGGGPV